MIRNSLLAMFLSIFSVWVFAADGDLDLTFNPGTGIGANVSDPRVHTIAVQVDGKLIIGGVFTAFNGIARNRIARLNSDGSLDNNFNPGGDNYNYVLTSALQPDGKVILGGDFQHPLSSLFSKIVRVNSDGTQDWGFSAGEAPFGDVYSITVQPDGKVILGGYFNYFDYTTIRRGIARMNSNGTLDTTFDPGEGANTYSAVYTTALQSDGKVIIGGYFTTFDGVARNRIARLNNDGSLDTSFDPGTGANNGIETTALQSDGKVIIGGYFTTFDGVARNRIARLNSDGSLDTSFDPGTGANNGIETIALQSDGKVIIGGYFSTFNGIARNGVARILASAEKLKSVRHNTDADNDSDLLTRSTSLGTWTRHTIQNAAITGTGSMNAYTSSSVQYVAQLDANGDGDADILTRNTSTGAWYLHQVQSGAVTSTAPIYLYASLDQQFIGTGDFNNDGIDDVMLRSASGGYYTVFLLSNHGVNSTVFYNAWTSSASVPQGIGDFDGDGTDDLLVRRTSDNLYFIFKTTNGGVANVTCACNLWANPDWTFQFAGDTNKDGTDDIVIRGTGASADGKWWNFRMSNFSSAETTNLNTFLNKTAVSFAASGDYNGDGHTDMLIRVNNGPVYVARVVNGVVSGSTTLLSNFPADQVVLK